MAENSKIEWTTHTFNPWRGCTKVSPGCSHCYADSQAKRNPKTLGIWGDAGTRVVAAEKTWGEPVKWDRDAAAIGERHRVFCASMADVFEDWQGAIHTHLGERLVIYKPNGGMLTVAPYAEEPPAHCRWMTMADLRSRLFWLIGETPNLDWLLLTKRPENISRLLPEYHPCGIAGCEVLHIRPNVWLGTTVENRQHGLPRIDLLRSIPAAVRFLSIEPLLEDLGTIDLTGIHWVIVGGESGHHARPMNPDWARSIRDQCQAAGVAYFFKQWGEWVDEGQHGDLKSPQRPANRGSTTFQSQGDEGDVQMLNVGKKAAGRLLDGREWNEMPGAYRHAPEKNT